MQVFYVLGCSFFCSVSNCDLLCKFLPFWLIFWLLVQVDAFRLFRGFFGAMSAIVAGLVLFWRMFVLCSYFSAVWYCTRYFSAVRLLFSLTPSFSWSPAISLHLPSLIRLAASPCVPLCVSPPAFFSHYFLSSRPTPQQVLFY